MNFTKSDKDVNYDKFFAIGVNATNDVNPCQKLEVLDENGNTVLLDSFKSFFKDPESAKSKYKDIFNYLRVTSLKTDSTKFTVLSHNTNIDEIRAGKSEEFIIKILILEGDNEIKYNLGKLLNNSEIASRLLDQGIDYKNINLDKLGLNGILGGLDPEGYTYLFNSGIGGGTHNIASTIISFSEIIKSKWFNIIAPNYIDKSKNYTSRTSLFLQEDNIKYCIRTEANEEQINTIYEIIQDYKNNISDILVTDKNSLSFKEIGLHSVPTIFSENVLHNVSTVVFNCEDREMGEVIEAVINEAKIFLDNSKLYYELSVKLGNLLNGLKWLQNKLNNYNLLIFDKKVEINSKNDRIENYEYRGIVKEKIKQNASIEIINDEILDLSTKRINVLKEILPTLVEVTKISENIKNQNSNNHKKEVNNKQKSNLGRVVLITDGGDGSVGSIEINNHEIFFINTIWKIGEYEKIFFKKLKSTSKGQIDLSITDTTGCGDSSTAAALMIREQKGLELRREKYLEILMEMGVPESSYNRSLAIIESYFLSHLQEVISGVVYHCKKSNLGDLPNNNIITSMILSYVFKGTLKFVKEGMQNFTYGLDNSMVIDGRVYDGFNVVKISEI